MDISPAAWPQEVYRVLKDHGVRQMSYVPDAGHSRLIELFQQDADTTTNVLTTPSPTVDMSIQEPRFDHCVGFRS